MKIINKNWQRKIEIEDNIIYTLVFENKKYYRESIIELINQHKGDEGNFIFSNDNKEFQLEKYGYLITDIFNIDVNNKKVLSKVYSSLVKQIIDDTIEYNELTSHIRAYFEKLIFNSLFEIEQGDELDSTALLKLGDFKIIFVVGLHNVFTCEELKAIYIKKYVLIKLIL